MDEKIMIAEIDKYPKVNILFRCCMQIYYMSAAGDNSMFCLKWFQFLADGAQRSTVLSDGIIRKKSFICFLSNVNYSQCCEEWLSGLFRLDSSGGCLSSDVSLWVYCLQVYRS